MTKARLTAEQFREAVNFKGRDIPTAYSEVPNAEGSTLTARVTDAAKKRGEIMLYGVIGMDWFGDGITAKKFEKELKSLGSVDVIDLHVNSEGGSVHEARAIYNLLNVHKARVEVHIDSLAASAASFISMAGDKIIMAESGFFMIHNAKMYAGGEAKDFRAAADFLDTVNRTIVDTYQARTGNSADKLRKWMDAETWFTGQEALDAGFATDIVKNKTAEDAKAKVAIDPAFAYRNMPAAFRSNRAKAMAILGR